MDINISGINLPEQHGPPRAHRGTGGSHEPQRTRMEDGVSDKDTRCEHCGERRAEHIRRHHGNGTKGTVWYCPGPLERIFKPAN